MKSYYLSVDAILWSRNDADFDFEGFAAQCGVQNIRVSREQLDSGKTHLKLSMSTTDVEAALRFKSKIEVMSRYAGTDGFAVTSNF